MPHDPLNRACPCDDCEAFYEERRLPKWLRIGRKVAIPGGPEWTIINVMSHSMKDDEVTVRQEGDTGPGAVWKARQFVEVWAPVEPTRASRFDRKEVL